ncbi:hypothetical protein Cni_G01989 [Canna indica]|uniref:Remorin C-terminal domain-containing protein n=1 Tax=Canna indica TaxID=4628 RepID=A0AAQ3Q2A5_9LILI|nr:hypothetical protein Cni_G01989 [Canna indica]
MELKAPSYVQSSTPFPVPATGRHSLDSDSSFYCNSKGNPFADSFPDPLCKLNLKETSDFVKAFPVTTRFSTDSRSLLKSLSQRSGEGLGLMGQRRLESPRAAISFNPGHLYGKNIPSKWDDAEKWLSSSCHESPAHATKPTDSTKISRKIDVFIQKGDSFAEKRMSFTEKKAQISTVASFDEPVMRIDPNVAFCRASSELLLKDKFTDNVEQLHPNCRYSEPTKEGFLFRSSYVESKNSVAEETVVQQTDIGTEMTPVGSSMPTRCHTPIKSSSPARHNTPADRSGLLVPCNTSIDILELKDCHFAKLELSTQYDSVFSNWSSKEEEEKEVSKSLMHLGINNENKNSGASRAYAWEEDERTKSCIRYQREEEKIQAWLNLQNAEAEAQSRKLEVKIQKMRSNLEEKLMKRMTIVHKRAEEWRTAAQQQHLQQLGKALDYTQKMKNQHNSHFSINTRCSCFPFSNQM